MDKNIYMTDTIGFLTMSLYDSKKKLLKSLERTNAFWSFNKNNLDAATIKDSLLIEYTFIHGDVGDIKSLFYLYPRQQLNTVWQQKLIPDKRLQKLNHYLGVCFFHIPDIKNHILNNRRTNSRYEKLKQLAREYKIGIPEIIKN